MKTTTSNKSKTFTERVYNVVSKIKPGSIKTYREVARLAGSPRAFRSVGSVLKKNYDPTIPCHRVVRTDGVLGEYNRGRANKRKLLFAEIEEYGVGKMLPQVFFKKNALSVARTLLGKTIVQKTPQGTKRFVITETEAYVGPHDLACHAAKGRTNRTEAMFLEGGYVYMYFIYGMYWMLNIVTGGKEYPSAVLIRGAGMYDGPGKLTKALGLKGALNAKKLGKNLGLWIEDHGIKLADQDVVTTPRIGVDYAGPIWSKKHYRFHTKK